MPVAVRVEDKEKYVLISLEGDGRLGWAQIGAIADDALKAISSKPVIYMRNPIKILGSVEISLMLRIQKKTKQHKVETCFCGIDSKAKEALKLAALDKLWSLYETLEEAEQHILS